MPEQETVPTTTPNGPADVPSNPQSLAEAQQVLQAMRQIKHRVEELETARNQQVAALDGTLSAARSPLLEDYERLKGVMLTFSQGPGQQYLDPKRSITFADGSVVGFRWSKIMTMIADPASFCRRALRRGLKRLLKVRYEPDKAKILKRRDLVRGMHGVSFQRVERFFIELPGFETDLSDINRQVILRKEA